MNSSHFSISLHILTLLDQVKGQLLNSEYIAGSINCNPVLVRKELANLHKHGFVQSKEGKGGGSTLAKNPEDINLGDVYKAVKQKSLLGESKNEPNPDCPVGKQITKHLNNLYAEAENALVKNLATKSLKEFSAGFK
ncbi:Rrf2 family transcriptional regulator [Pedobacter sp. Leaf216]|uniref:Rrf2 family transcriptional regulator n=1 Tax=Pedobacter sp. Leaf216 TaxID=1735684 RepID=UPI0006FE3B5D|nr:Rrf2 family transcriptional regulator [Pedobacter sp. Leaf216]KQM77356.1 Rrf2 family transcriptional regulator [Pedobacter sp. Leaf216]